jgi:hypothetical protein
MYMQQSVSAPGLVRLHNFLQLDGADNVAVHQDEVAANLAARIDFAHCRTKILACRRCVLRVWSGSRRKYKWL